MQNLKRLQKSPFCKAIKHRVIMDKIFEDCKTSELAMLMDSRPYETNKYVKDIANICI